LRSNEQIEIHPTSFPLLQLRKESVIYSPKIGNVSMMKSENAADIADALLGSQLDTSPNIPKGLRLDANKLQATMTYARVSALVVNLF
jgi:hypothetical protein